MFCVWVELSSPVQSGRGLVGRRRCHIFPCANCVLAAFELKRDDSCGVVCVISRVELDWSGYLFPNCNFYFDVFSHKYFMLQKNISDLK